MRGRMLTGPYRLGSGLRLSLLGHYTVGWGGEGRDLVIILVLSK